MKKYGQNKSERKGKAKSGKKLNKKKKKRQ
jgi:hypothetical protein